MGRAPLSWLSCLLALSLLRVAPAHAFEPTFSFRDPAGVGLTPGGLLFRVDGGELVLVTPAGEERARHRLAAGEKSILAAADDGSRITSPWAGGVRQDTSGVGRARLVFRSADGTRERILELTELISNLASFGSDAFAVTQDGKELTLHRLSAAEGDVPLLRLPRKELLSETGKIRTLAVHASAAGVLVAVSGPYRTVWLHPDGTWLRPDPAIDCGAIDFSALLFPDGAGTVARVRASSGERASTHLERISKDGRLLSSVRLPVSGTFFPLPGVGLVAVLGPEVVVVDARGNELSRAPFGGASPAAAARLARVRRVLDETGSLSSTDWVELALASPEPPAAELARIGDGGEPGLLRLTGVPDDHPDVAAAQGALPWLLRSLPYLASKATRPVTLEVVEGLAIPGPAWLRRAASSWVLQQRKGEPPPDDWALVAAAEAIQRGEDLEPPLPDRLLTRDLAERIALFDRARLDELDRLPAPVDAVNEAELHVPASRFPDLVLSCALLSGPARFRAVVASLIQPAVELENATRPVDFQRGDDTLDISTVESPPGDDAGDGDVQSVEAFAGTTPSVESSGRVAGLLAGAVRSEDGDLRAAAALLSPFYRLPLDVKAFRRDVLPRAAVTDIASSSLLHERLLPSAEWSRLFGELLTTARQRSQAPGACLQVLGSLSRSFLEEDDSARDPYCQLLASLLAPGPAAAGTGRDRELAELASAPGAPPEVRVFTRFGRAIRGAFDTAGGGTGWTKDILDLWQDADVPADLRLQALQYVAYSPDAAGLAEIAPALLRQVRQGRLPAKEEAVVAHALSKTSPLELSRIVAERLVGGSWRPPDADSATAWLSRLDRSAVAADPRLRQSLLRLLDDEDVAPEAAAALARAGEPAALPALLVALKSGCFG